MKHHTVLRPRNNFGGDSAEHAWREIDRENPSFLGYTCTIIQDISDLFHTRSKPVFAPRQSHREYPSTLWVLSRYLSLLGGGDSRQFRKTGLVLRAPDNWPINLFPGVRLSAKPVSSNETIYRTVPRFEGFCTPSTLGNIIVYATDKG